MVNFIRISDVVNSTSFNKDGEIIFDLVKTALLNNQQVTVSFEGIYALNTSFVNSAFIELLEHFSFDEIKNNLKFVDSTKQINSIIGKRFIDTVTKNELLATM
ncbi:STAS-like domain-containing protein [Sporosarcina sp. FSL K6-2383]|uniref:STAS-like domain-containing protein n=1 Tax=Sporosarcina sp. FSL K6-2383 TaxID=2921556 RepID=UPI00315A81F9